MFVQDALVNRARIQPNKPAFIIDGARCSCGDIRVSASRMAQAPRLAGVARGDQAAICPPYCGASDFSIIGTFKAAVVPAAVNRTTKPGKPLQKLNSCGASVLVT
jgi:acyl-CoA synthetase (AMP-forming)/AMP-acid ligase II